MSKDDRERWNRRYAARDLKWSPNSWLAEVADEIRPSRPDALALDVACGYGRNAIRLAELGYAVDAWDVSDVGLGLLRDRLTELAGAGRALDVRPREIDLDGAAIPPATYDLIANILFLDRRLFPLYADSLRPGGLLLFETFVDLEDGRRADIRPEHLLRPGELAQSFGALDVLQYGEDAERGTARLLARKR